MRKGPLFQKKDKPTTDQQIMEVGVRLRALDKKYRVLIEKEVRQIRYDKEHKQKDNLRAISKAKNAYYGLNIVNSMHERLADITSTQELNKALNETGSLLKMLNKLDNKSEKVKSFTLNWQLKKHNKTMGKMEGGMPNVFREPIDALVDDDVINRLVRGDSVDKCLDGNDGILCDMDEAISFSDDFFAELGEINLGTEENMDIDELLRSL